MSYDAAVERLYALAAELHTPSGSVRRKFRLEDVRILLSALGEPQRRFPSILIAGTNGKGSTAATLASILKSAGYGTGLYTSPHVERVNERIQINGQPIEDEMFARLFSRVEGAAQELVVTRALPALPSFFEALTAMAFLCFAGESQEGATPSAAVEIAVLEVGLGGRLDATNVVEPLLSVITDISLDHTEWLGETIDAIAREKAGILRKNGLLVTLPQHPEANQAIGEVAVPLGVRAVNAANYLPGIEPLTDGARAVRNRYPLMVMGKSIEVDSPLVGHHQRRNIALAIAAAVELRSVAFSNSDCYNLQSLDLAASDIERGIRETVWPGRLESIAANGGLPEILLDVAHNPAGAWALRSALSGLLEAQPRSMTLIFGCLRDKPVKDMAQILFPLFDRVFLCPVDSPRAAQVDEMLAAAVATGSDAEASSSAMDALGSARKATPPDGLIVVAGSVLLVGAVRSLLHGWTVIRSSGPSDENSTQQCSSKVAAVDTLDAGEPSHGDRRVAQ